MVASLRARWRRNTLMEYLNRAWWASAFVSCDAIRTRAPDMRERFDLSEEMYELCEDFKQPVVSWL